MPIPIVPIHTFVLPLEQELRERLGWFIQLRWGAALGVIVGTWVATVFFGLDLPRVSLYSIGLIVFIYNVLFYFYVQGAERKDGGARRRERRSYNRFAHVQISLDWVALIFLVHYSGGMESPITFYFIFHVIIASLLLSRRSCYAHATIAFALLVLLASLEYFSTVPHVFVRGFSSRALAHEPFSLFGHLFFFGSTLYISAFLAGSMSNRLRQHEEELFTSEQNLERAYQEMGVLYEVGKLVNSTLDLQEVLHLIAKHAAHVMRVKACSIRLLDEGGKELRIAATYGLTEAYLTKGRIEVAKSPIDQEALSGKPVAIPDINRDSRFQYPEEAEREGICSVLCVPLRARDKIIGVIRVYCSQCACFELSHVEFLSYLASMGAIAIENARSYQALEQLDRVKSQFVTTVTHELRAPIATIQSLLRVVLHGYAGDRTQELIQRADRRAKALLDLVNDLLDLAEGRMDLQEKMRGPVRLDRVMEVVFEAVQGRAEEKGIEVHQDISAEPLVVQADEEGLERVFVNLVDNAVKYTPSGGHILVHADQHNGKIYVEVTDTGIGIAPEALPRVFEEFYRAENAKKVEQEGTGLGLAIVQRLVERYGGTISVQSAVGKGTTFSVELPAVEDIPPSSSNCEL